MQSHVDPTHDQLSLQSNHLDRFHYRSSDTALDAGFLSIDQKTTVGPLGMTNLFTKLSFFY